MCEDKIIQRYINQARNVKPTVVTYGTAMQALAASGRHVEAFHLLESMKKVGEEVMVCVCMYV